MASVMAIVSKAVFDDLPVYKWVGEVAALDRYKSKNPAFANLGNGDAIFLVTVRNNDVLWLVSILEEPKKKGDAWTSAINRAPITDITSLLKKIELANGEGISAKKGKLGMSLQTPRVLADADVKLLRKAAPKKKQTASEAVEMDMRKQKRAKKASEARKAIEEAGGVPNKGGKVSAAARAMIEQVYASPGDRGLREVLADKLLEEHHVWGELISLQLADPKKHKRRIEEIIEKHAGDMCGPIVHLSIRENLKFVDGFLSECKTSKALAWGGVGRKHWDKAATAREWATVEHVRLDTYHTPVWWVEKWMKKAPLTNLRSVMINKAGIERDKPGDPWRVHSPKLRWPEKRLDALVKSLPPDELERAIPASEPARVLIEKFRAPKKR